MLLSIEKVDGGCCGNLDTQKAEIQRLLFMFLL